MKLYGVCVLQAEVAGAEYDEFPYARPALDAAMRRARELGAEHPRFEPDPNWANSWACDGPDWSVTIKRWR